MTFCFPLTSLLKDLLSLHYIQLELLENVAIAHELTLEHCNLEYTTKEKTFIMEISMCLLLESHK